MEWHYNMLEELRKDLEVVKVAVMKWMLVKS